MLRASKVRLSRPDWKKDHALVFHATDTTDLGPVETHMLPEIPALSPDQVAALFCRSAASSVGWAQVVDQRVMVSDHRTQLDKFDRVLDRVGATHRQN